MKLKRLKSRELFGDLKTLCCIWIYNPDKLSTQERLILMNKAVEEIAEKYNF
jgi:hypothetical protein